MGHYLFRASYSQAGLQGFPQGRAAARTAVMSGLCESLGGRLVTNHWAFGSATTGLGERPCQAGRMAGSPIRRAASASRSS